jgi:hypothetical protein
VKDLPAVRDKAPMSCFPAVPLRPFPSPDSASSHRFLFSGHIVSSDNDYGFDVGGGDVVGVTTEVVLVDGVSVPRVVVDVTGACGLVEL